MKGRMDDWKRKFGQFMAGRYGADQFTRFLSGCIIVFLIANFVFHSRLLYWLALLLLCYSYFRMFSKNIPARFRENERFMGLRFQAGEKVKRWRFKAGQAMAYHIYRCPGCGQKIRIPRGKGKISIHCPKCHTDFIRRS